MVNKTSFVQINLELRIILVLLAAFISKLVCEYFKVLMALPWLFKWPDYEEDYPEEGNEDFYAN